MHYRLPGLERKEGRIMNIKLFLETRNPRAELLDSKYDHCLVGVTHGHPVAVYNGREILLDIVFNDNHTVGDAHLILDDMLSECFGVDAPVVVMGTDY